MNKKAKKGKRKRIGRIRGFSGFIIAISFFITVEPDMEGHICNLSLLVSLNPNFIIAKTYFRKKSFDFCKFEFWSLGAFIIHSD